jgi:hypothetical protein
MSRHSIAPNGLDPGKDEKIRQAAIQALDEINKDE